MVTDAKTDFLMQSILSGELSGTGKTHKPMGCAADG